jgi:hypothetical protein
MHLRNGIRWRERRTCESNTRADLKSNTLQHYTALYYLEIEVLGFCGYGRQTQCKLSLLSSTVFRGQQGTFTVMYLKAQTHLGLGCVADMLCGYTAQGRRSTGHDGV